MHGALNILKILIFTTYAQMHQSFWYSQALFQTQMHTSTKAEREETGQSLRQHAHRPSDAHYAQKWKKHSKSQTQNSV